MRAARHSRAGALQASRAHNVERLDVPRNGIGARGDAHLAAVALGLSYCTVPSSSSMYIASVGQFATQAGISQWLHADLVVHVGLHAG